jgi:hypothetical protein
MLTEDYVKDLTDSKYLKALTKDISLEPLSWVQERSTGRRGKIIHVDGPNISVSFPAKYNGYSSIKDYFYEDFKIKFVSIATPASEIARRGY